MVTTAVPVPSISPADKGNRFEFQRHGLTDYRRTLIDKFDKGRKTIDCERMGGGKQRLRTAVGSRQWGRPCLQADQCKDKSVLKSLKLDFVLLNTITQCSADCASPALVFGSSVGYVLQMTRTRALRAFKLSESLPNTYLVEEHLNLQDTARVSMAPGFENNAKQLGNTNQHCVQVMPGGG